MKVWYSCKVKHTRIVEDGSQKQVTDTFLVDAVSYTDAEKRIYEAMEQDAQGEFAVTTISKTTISEVVNYDDADTWFKCKVSYSTVDAASEKETKITTYFLVSAENVKQAYERVDDNLSSMLVPFEVPSITLTNFVEVYPYNEEEALEEEIPDNLTPISEFEGEENEQSAVAPSIDDFEKEESTKEEEIFEEELGIDDDEVNDLLNEHDAEFSDEE